MNIRIKLVIVGILIPVIIYLWPSALGGTTEILIVQGQSMLPTILPGSLVVAKQASEYNVGEIVAFVQKSGTGSQKIVVHRIIEETEQGFVIMGDNNPTKDPGFQTSENILGTVIFATPYVGDVFALLRNPIVLIISAGVIGAIQMEQKRRKTKKEKLRRIRLGIPKYEKPTESEKKPKKPDYTLFFAAIAINVIVYVLVLIAISSGIKPTGDILTGFLFKGLMSSFAATVSFALYFIFIIGMYFLAKIYEAKSQRREQITGRKAKSSLRLLLGKDTNPVLAVASFLWLLFVVMELFHLMTLVQDMGIVVN